MPSPELRSTETPRREANRKKEIPSADISLSPERRQKITHDRKTRSISLGDVYKDTEMTDPPVVSYQDLPGLLSNPNLQDLRLIARLTPEMIKTLTADIAQAKELAIPRRKQIMDELYILAENTRSHFETLKANQTQVDKYTKGIGGKLRGFFFRGAKEEALGKERAGAQALAAWEAVSKVMYLLQISLNRARREPLPPKTVSQPVPEERATIGEVVAWEKADTWSDIHAESWNEEPEPTPPSGILPKATTKPRSVAAPPESNLTDQADIEHLQNVNWADEDTKTEDLSPSQPKTVDAWRMAQERRASARRSAPIQPVERPVPRRAERRPPSAQGRETADNKTRSLMRNVYVADIEAMARHTDFADYLKNELENAENSDVDTINSIVAEAANRELKRQSVLAADQRDSLFERSLEKLIRLHKAP